MIRWAVITALHAVVVMASPAVASAPIADAAISQAGVALRPGQYVWTDAAKIGEPISISISIALQRLYVHRGEALIGIAAISSGKRGHATPLGEFQILQKDRWHRSNIYSNAPMPFMQRLTWDGIAIHAGMNPGYPASHGCIRVPAAFAKDLFAMTSLGVRVAVSDYPSQPPVYLRIVGLERALAEDELILAPDDGIGPVAILLDYSPSVFAIP